jgi:hypothetical protein
MRKFISAFLFCSTFSGFLSVSISLSMSCTIPFISYHQFLTRPINGSILNLPRPPTDPQSKLKPPLREALRIKHPDVHDLCFEILWERIFDSFDEDHDMYVCNCCRGKGLASDGMQSNFVVVICGDLRQHASSGRSWAWYFSDHIL